ncbi:hypothetical protein BRADI_2g20543v3 [Brachypodium distachyon]|uniref:Uncharacterized protein n=1 Tax=Brachypodium distachyon TaxID=15368 RepID=A0A0Q3QW70_BRADI|nr:hypothetical protein BRADI_2g20543v3 [Brachypodium distachyon]
MGRRPDRSVGALACCRFVVVVVFVLCVGLLVTVVAATTGGRDLGPNRAAAATMSYPGGGVPGGADPFRSSKRRIPKGPDPIHNRRAGTTTVAPRRRD